MKTLNERFLGALDFYLEEWPTEDRKILAGVLEAHAKKWMLDFVEREAKRL